jgi:hypothetical protein
MKTLLLAFACAALGCGSASSTPTGDGEVVSCSCAVADVLTDGLQWANTIDVSQCLKDFSVDPVTTAESKCVAIADSIDTRFNYKHKCACTCVHTTESCHTQ